MQALRLLAIACLMLSPALAAAQVSALPSASLPPSSSLANDPLDPRAPVPPLPAVGALDGYTSFQPARVAAWRQSNDTVAAAPPSHAGHAGHGVSTAPDPHAGHNMSAAPDPHAGHNMGATSDPHAGHNMGATPTAAAEHQHAH